MSTFDEYVNGKLQSSQFAIGVSTVLFSMLSKSIIPKLPPEVYRILDVTVVRILVLAFLITSQTKKPTWSLFTATAIVYFFKVLTKYYVPDIPPLSEIVKPDEANDKKDQQENSPSPVVCNCSPQIHLPENGKGQRHWVT